MNSLSIRSILVGSDLGDSSDQVLRAAAAVAALTGAKLHVLHAFDVVHTPYASSQAAQPVNLRVLMRDAELALSERIRRTVPSGVTIASRRVVDQPPHRAILQRAAEVEADLVVLGPHRRRMGDWLLGGTADRVVRAGAVPCLVVRRPLALPLRRVVAPLDPAQPVRGALDLVLAWSAALAGPRAEISLLHVLPLDYAVAPPDLGHALQGAVSRVPATAAMEIQQQLEWGDAPAAEIVAFADRGDAELVVLATHGYGPTRRALLGSVSFAVAFGASCSVLLVPPALWRATPVPGERAAQAAPELVGGA